MTIVVGQRPGPSTGIPTYTAQTDLHFVLNAGQGGEFPRFVVAPGDLAETYSWSATALALSWKYQVPSIILTDKTLAEGACSFDLGGAVTMHPDREPELWGGGTGEYRRYARIKSGGVSPLAFPGRAGGTIVKANSYAHDEAGFTTEAAGGEVTALQEKMLRKGESLKEELSTYPTVRTYGARDAGRTIVCWGGSEKWACIEAAEEFDARVVQPLVLAPFPARAWKEAMIGGGKRCLRREQRHRTARPPPPATGVRPGGEIRPEVRRAAVRSRRTCGAPQGGLRMTPPAGRPAGDLISPAENTWCPGCGNFSIEHMMKSAIAELSEEERIPIENFVLLGGIGCHGKLVDYLNVNSFYGIHGRSVPAATGIRLANPDLKVICHVGGRGTSTPRGLDHLLFAAKRNSDITVIVHDNRVYGLTTGAVHPPDVARRIPRPFHPPGRDHGTPPLKPARSHARRRGGHPYRPRLHQEGPAPEGSLQGGDHAPGGFSFVDVLQICATYFNLTDYYNEHAYEMKEDEVDTGRFESALGKIREWDYDREAPIPLGTFYSVGKPIYEEEFRALTADRSDRRALVRNVIEEWR